MTSITASSSAKCLFLAALLLCNVIHADSIPSLDCKGNTNLNLSSPDHPLTVPYIGHLKALMFFVDLDGLPGKDNANQPDAIAKRLFDIKDHGEPGIVEFYRQQSFGKLDYHVDIDYRWLHLDKKVSKQYPGPGRPTEYIRDALMLAKNSGCKLEDYQIVYIGAPKGVMRLSPTHYFEKNELTELGKYPHVVVTLGDDGQQSRLQHMVHETGHAMGLPDEYLFDRANKPKELTVPGPWDIMCDNWKAVNFSAWNRHLWKWLPDERKLFVKQSQPQIELSPLDSTTGTAMIVIPTERFPSEVLVIENPKPWDPKINEGVLIYTVDASVAAGKGPMKLQLPPNVTDEYQANALWQPGQTYTNPKAGIKVQILKKKDHMFVLDVGLETNSGEQPAKP